MARFSTLGIASGWYNGVQLNPLFNWNINDHVG